jgi:enamine deaminase RidA (YjgF/YER057c/UK114 family)
MSDPIQLIADVPGLAAAPGYSYAATTTRTLVFLAGQVAHDADRKLVGGDDFEAQARQVFINLGRVLDAAGCGPADILKLTYYVVGLARERLLAVRRTRDAFFGASGAKPASTLIGVSALFDPGALIEIEAVAARAT